MRYRLIGALCLGALGACGDPVGPEGAGFEFSSQRVFGVGLFPPTIETGEGFFEVAGLFEAPQARYRLTGTLVVSQPNRIQVVVLGEPEFQSLVVRSLHLFRGRVSRLPRGNYDFQLAHVVVNGDRRDSTVVYTAIVGVP